MKRLFSCLLAVWMVLSLAAPAQAALITKEVLKQAQEASKHADTTSSATPKTDITSPSGSDSDILGGVHSGSSLNGDGTIFWEESYYCGNCKNGKPYGEGTFYYADGTCLSGDDWDWVTGEFDSWVPDRQGADMYYTGMTLDGEFCGYGKLEFNAGGTFQGEFQEGDPQGWGIYTYRSPKSEKKATKESDNWKTLYKNKAHNHTYTGLAIGKTWQGFGIGITKNKYAYCGEIVSNYRDGHGELYTAKDKLEKWGIYREGSLKKSYAKP